MHSVKFQKAIGCPSGIVVYFTEIRENTEYYSAENIIFTKLTELTAVF